ncbi:molybdenum cofactor biosynthesis protein moac [hydrocarbon metagenome]|uniref:cyclic pyranopterin monophosphate synthase n=1 Tax=hydrocarbon metagenome TaxID=938273 RepID=A0A0W8E742_9ZZZZ
MDFTHINNEGRARMVDVSGKDETERAAIARAVVKMKPETINAIKSGGIKKGDVLSVAQVAGIMGAKNTAGLIPMCHPLMLTSVDISFQFDQSNSSIIIESQVKTTGKTGVEMEAITAVTIAALTIYDMGKALDRWMEIGGIMLVEKSGGKSGHVKQEEKNQVAQSGRLYSICVSPERGQIKREVFQANIIEDHGIENDGHAGPWNRQVTCLDRASVLKANQEHGFDAGPGDFAENLLIEGIDFKELGIGSRLKVGESAVLEVSQIGKEDHPSIVTRTLGVSLLPYEGLFCRVIQGGKIKKADVVEVI